ncbi:DUF4407 domain-containing protein [Vaginella massiliensis]|uniref:DUF4407 domain-containing protein n=1 Tax=Vaginella massiliensis TaxID=1816680 RepID=UPI003750B007
MNRIQKFLILCSGSSLEILKKTPTDLNKHAGIGGVILFTGILASLSAGYALYTIFDQFYLAILFGLLWGLMIFNLDRYIVTSMKNKGSIFRQFFIALPRIAVAVLLGIVISKPLELKIFEKEIDKQLNLIIARNKAELLHEINLRYQTMNADYHQEQKEIYSRIENLRNEYQNAATELEKEVVGTATETTTGREGYGPNAKRKAALKEQKKQEMEAYIAWVQPRLATITKEIDNINKGKEKEIAAANTTEELYNGFAARIQTLDELESKNPVMGIASLFIVLVFISLETAPVLVKLIAPRGPYDYLLEKHEYTFRIFAKEAIEIMDIKSDRRIKNEIAKGNL